jgi:hypothetical protein
VLQRPVEPEQFTSLRWGERLAEIGAVPSIGSVGDCFDCEHPVVAAVRGLTLVMTGPAGALALTCRPSRQRCSSLLAERAVT